MSIPSITNCPNCGAPIDISRSSCEYCGTPYPEKPETAKLYADNQLVMEVQIESNKRSDELIKQLIDRDRLLLKAYKSSTAWQPTEEQKRKIIENSVNSVKTVMDHYDQELKTIRKKRQEALTLLFAALFGVVIPMVLTAIVNFIF